MIKKSKIPKISLTIHYREKGFHFRLAGTQKPNLLQRLNKNWNQRRKNVIKMSSANSYYQKKKTFKKNLHEQNDIQ